MLQSRRPLLTARLLLRELQLVCACMQSTLVMKTSVQLIPRAQLSNFAGSCPAEAEPLTTLAHLRTAVYFRHPLPSSVASVHSSRLLFACIRCLRACLRLMRVCMIHTCMHALLCFQHAFRTDLPYAFVVGSQRTMSVHPQAQVLLDLMAQQSRPQPTEVPLEQFRAYVEKVAKYECSQHLSGSCFLNSMQNPLYLQTAGSTPTT